MSDKYKGFLVTFDKEVTDEKMEELETLLYNLRNVKLVTPYVKGMEDYMSERKGYLDLSTEINEMINKKLGL